MTLHIGSAVLVSCRDPLLLGPRLGGQESEATAAGDHKEDAPHKRLDLSRKLYNGKSSTLR